MGRITIELLRKRCEHNDGLIHTLEELSLHQEKLEKIDLLDTLCKPLKILLLQNNVISKIENVSKLKNLEYLNLALNNIELVENLEGCESLQKLDLTLNFVKKLSSIKCLKDLQFLESLYLVGNPCADYSGYRQYVICILPQLSQLDGQEILQSERIQASQKISEIDREIKRIEAKFSTNCEKDAGDVKNFSEMSHEEFWNQRCADTPEMRLEMSQRLEEINGETSKKPTVQKKERKYFKNDGTPLNINEAKLPFTLQEDFDKNELVLDLTIPKFMDSSLLEPDVHPTYIRVKIKGKLFQIGLPEEIKVNYNNASAQRSQTTGHLVIRMTKLNENPSWRSNKIDSIPTIRPDNCDKKKTPEREIEGSKSKNCVDWRNIVEDNKKVQAQNNNLQLDLDIDESFEDDPSVPPLM